MQFGILATDYDGTIGTDQGLDPHVRAALEELHAQGIVIVVVTGRTWPDLRRVAGDLRMCDVVVAENGAVLAFPETGDVQLLAPPPPPIFLEALAARGIPAQAGASVVETDSHYGPQIVSIIQELELPLVIVFNRGRLMVLPHGVSKATGLHAALRLLRRSEHNAVGVGDAENDHALLGACELGVAVGWGSPALQAAADEVVPGKGPADLAPYLRALGARRRLPPARPGRWQVSVGCTTEGEPVNLAVRGSNVLIVGDSCSGKSWVAGRLAEQLVLQRYSLCLVDPEGDHRLLATLPGVVVLGSEYGPPATEEVALALRHPDLSVIVNLSAIDHAHKTNYVSALLPELVALRARTGLPHRIIVDEAHQFLREPRAAALVDPELEGYTLITYRLTDLDPALRATCPVVLTTRLTDPAQINVLGELRGNACNDGDWRTAVEQLAIGEAVLFPGPPAPPGSWQAFQVGPRITGHVRHRAKYVDVELPDAKAFVFTEHGRPTGQRVHTMRQLAALVRRVPGGVLAGHLARHDLSRWVGEVFADETLARQLAMLEAMAPYEALSDLRKAVAHLVEERYLRGDE